MGDERFVPENTAGIVFIRIAVPDLKVQKCLQFQLEHTVWQAKQRVLASFAKDLRDALNYGLYLPPANGRAGKFMEEERLLSEYPIQGPIGFLEFKYKRRVYKMMQINERKLKQIHTKAKLKTFMELVRNGSTEKLNKLTLKGFDPNFHDSDNGETPLTVAVTLGKSKCREVIIALVSGGSHLDFRNRQGLTALHRAAIVGNGEAIRTMLDLGASPNCKDMRDLTPLYYSVSNDDAVQECTLMLLHERARIGTCDENGWYEIHQACKYGRVQHLEHLVFYGADMDVRNTCGNTPLHICALNNQEACARLLLFRGADATLCNYSNQTADQVAAMAGNSILAALIRDHNPDDVVPYREIPKYSDRRKGASLTPSLRALLRSRSDPRINHAGLDSRSTSNSSSPSGALIRRGQTGPGSDCSISVASAGSVTGVTDHGMYEGRTMTGREGYFPGGHLTEVNIRRAGSMGDVNNTSRATSQRNTLAPLVHTVREHQPRIVLLHRSAEGYGFVLRGAKSKLPSGGGFSDFTPTAEYPALQYLDSVDPGSQADRASLRAGDFILEINGENVVRASHEHVVHLIRSSSDVLTLKVVTVTLSDPTPSDWQTYPEMGANTLPARKKVAAPLPPQRDPQTSLSYSKASFKSMREGLAEIEKLDATLAEFEGEEEARSRSMHALQGADDHKVASVRATHALKRVSVMDYEGLITGDPGSGSATEYKAGKGHVSPAEARIKKYHKRSPSQTIERSKSTPDISAAGDDEHYHDGKTTGSWTKNRAPAPPTKGVQYAPANASPYPGNVVYASGPNGQKSSGMGTPTMPNRSPLPTSESVRVHTAGRHTIYGNSFPESGNQNTVDPSSFRTGDKRANPEHYMQSNQNGDKSISFADDRVMENAQKFIQKYPNAKLLVTADVHSDKTDGKDRIMYEPEPDYDDSDNDKSAFITTDRLTNSSANLRQNRGTEDQRNFVNGNNSTRQNKSSVTVISITSDSNKEGLKQIPSSHSSPHLVNSVKSSPLSNRMQENMTLNSPVQSLSSSRRSSGVVMATPSQPSSAESSRRSSIQSNYSGDNMERNGRSFTPSSTSTITRNTLEAETPPPPPPPPLLASVGKSSPTENNSNSTLRRRPNDADAIAVLPSRVSTDDILAAVAERQNRIENDGPRLSEVKTLPTSKSTLELNQEALKAAVAKRKSRLEQGEDKSVVDEIEARLNRNKKLQAAKHFSSDVTRNGGTNKNEDEITSPSETSSTTSTSKSENLFEGGSMKPKNIPVQQEPANKHSLQVKLSPGLPTKSSQNFDTSSSEKSGKNSTSDPAKDIVDFRSKLKPVDAKGTGMPAAVQTKPTVTTSTATGNNITTIIMTKANSGKVQAPPPPPPPPTTTSATTQPSTAKAKPELPALITNKTGQKSEAKPATTNALSPTSNNTPSPADYIALAERARQEYLRKKASGNLQANIEKKGPVEITPNKKNSQRNKPVTPTSPTNPLLTSVTSNVVKSNQQTNVDSIVSVQDRIKVLQSETILTNGKASVAGVTEDHSHTEASLSNGTIKKPSSNSNVSSHINIIPVTSGLKSQMAPPMPPGFGDNDGHSSTTSKNVDIIPPPPSFSAADSPDSALSVPSFGQDASFMSSASSFSNFSSEHGNISQYGYPGESMKNLIAHSPPPPPDFEDTILGDQDAFIPPPPEFLEIDSNANESKTLDKNSKPFASKPVSDWSCMDVLDWLDSLSLPQYRISFAKAHIDGAKLANMGRNEFINLGVTQVGHRMNLERSVKKLNLVASTDL